MSMERGQTTELHPDGFKVLLDAPEDGCAEERCWVPIAFAPTAEDAIALALAEAAIYEGCGLKLVPAGRTWFRRDPAFKPDDGCWRNEYEDTTLDYEPWVPCTKRAKTGIEVWVLEVTDDA